MNTINHRSENKEFEFLYSISLFITFIYMIVQPIWHNPNITGIVWKSGIIIIFLSSLFTSRFIINKKDLVGLTILLFIIIINFAVTDDSITSNLIFSCLAFLCMLLEISFFTSVRISKKLFDRIYLFAVFLTLLFFSYTFTPIVNKYYYKEMLMESIYFVFNLDNSNTVGTYLYCLFCIILLNIPKRGKKNFNIILLIICFYMLYNTNCRSAIFSAIGVLILSLISFAKKMPKIFIVLAWLFPMVFVSLYMRFYDNGYENIIIFGKSLFSGRQFTYKEYLVYIYEPIHYFIGNLIGVQMKNTHNAPLSFYTSLGMIGAVTTELMLLFNVFEVNKPTKNSFFAVSAIMGLFIGSSAEASMFLGGFPGIVFLTSFFLLANYNDNDYNY